MDSRSRLQAALFGIKGGVAWVAEDAFVTRCNGDLLVERWVGRRVTSAFVSKGGGRAMEKIWEKLNEVAMADECHPSRNI